MGSSERRYRQEPAQMPNVMPMSKKPPQAPNKFNVAPPVATFEVKSVKDAPQANDKKFNPDIFN